MSKALKYATAALLMTVSMQVSAQENDTHSSSLMAEEGAWCWFADPRAIHYENAAGTINASYIGCIDVHGNIKATQYNWLTKRKTDVLVRSYFQPDDHNNPTFLVLPDERILIIYSRHTDEAAFYYRISKHPGDITNLGEEKRLATANNTTYPSPFILSDDPDHWYLCWRGIGWHPTIARLTMPDANDDVKFDFGPKQIVQSTGARPYAKYQSNGKDKIHLVYTTGHPDNEMPNWLYFNVIDINHGNGPILRDIKGTELKKIADGPFNVNKTSSYASTYPYTIVDKTDGVRNWVWQVALDKDEHPVIAMIHIDDAKTSHEYWYGRWTGTTWQRTKVQNAGHAFHQNWNSTERCYTGGASLDPDNINDLYISVPTSNGAYDRDGVYEIWKYTIDDNGKVAASQQITRNSTKNNSRPFILPGSKNSPLRLIWMNGDYYYWMVKKGYPQGYPTSTHADYEWTEELTKDDLYSQPDCICFGPGESIHIAYAMNPAKYEGTLLVVGNDEDGGMSYSIDASDQRPVIKVNGKTYKSQNRLLTSDAWAAMSSGTNGDNHPTKVETWILSLTCDGKTLTSYRNGLVDQVIELEEGDFWGDAVDNIWEQETAERHKRLGFNANEACQSPMTVQAMVKMLEQRIVQSLPTALSNGDFEGHYSIYEYSGVKSDRAIYVPEGWKLEYSDGNEYDLTALKQGDAYFSDFFASRPAPSTDSRQTYWVRQNWGTSSIALNQKMLLPESKYDLIADVWKSGLGGDAIISVTSKDGETVTAPSMTNKEVWQEVTLSFVSDGKTPTTVRLEAMHNNNGSEKIIGFDNISLIRHMTDDIQTFSPDRLHSSTDIYDLTGRRVATYPQQPGIYVQNGKKIIR